MSATDTTLSRLSRALLQRPDWSAPHDLTAPTPAMLALPERAIQFGTGAFLRGFVEYFLDAANAHGMFNGRVVVVGTTSSGRDRAFAAQEGLYTLVSRGTIDGVTTEDRRIIGSVSRALSAHADWDAVLACARAPELSVIFSNTTEVGIAIDPADTLEAAPPRSFPGKLTAFLYERARSFDFDPSKGVVVVPCELIESNGATLRALVHELAARWQFPPAFTHWLDAAVPFCNTLVDRIVPGTPSGDDLHAITTSLGYHDALLTTAEHFRQFVIEGDALLADRLGFASADTGIIITPDVGPYRQRKVGLLNGTHTIAVTAALLCGCETVRDAMTHSHIGPFIRRVLLDEIVPSMHVPDAEPFAQHVLKRFGNPYIRHALVDITLQGTTKLRVRLLPTIQRAADRLGAVPPLLVFGFAAHLLYLRGTLPSARRATGLSVPPDTLGDRIYAHWRATPTRHDGGSVSTFVDDVCADTAIWGLSLLSLPGFADAVTAQLTRMLTLGAAAALEELLTTGVS